MYINNINFNNMNFRAKISDNCSLKFAEIGKKMLEDNKYDEFRKNMADIRNTFNEATVTRKGGNGYCISYPRVFKISNSKAVCNDINIDKILTSAKLDEIVKLLRKTELEYKLDIKLYKDIYGKDFVIQ